MNWNLYLSFLLALLALINPITRLPPWKELTEDQDEHVRHMIARYVVLTASLIMLLFLLTGPQLLTFFGVDLSVFKMGGGILLFISGISMVQGRSSYSGQSDESGSEKEVAKKRFSKVFVPLAFPLLAGPGALTTAIIYGSKGEGVIDLTLLSIVIVFVMALILIFFRYSYLAEKYVDDIVFAILVRIVGIFIVAIGSQFIVEGIGEVFPQLVGNHGESVIEDNLEKAQEATKAMKKK